MDIASLLSPPRVEGASAWVRTRFARLGAAMLARAAERQAQSRTARLTAELVGAPAPLLRPRHGAFSHAVAVSLRRWQAL